ncbi:hypothetical protein [Aurantimicrobium sp.]|uniref:hypothetical protein n=1 Tax=Aurantimicrobium sp. TaxID=1930784 RepID=UPI002FC928BC
MDKSLKTNEESLIGVTAVVVGLNESKDLALCLPNLENFVKLIYVDLGSADDSLDVAEKFADETLILGPVPTVEEVHHKIMPTLIDTWVLIMDPDEVIDPSLKEYLKTNLHILKDPHLGAIYAPCRYYFRSKPLKGTPWGGLNERLILAQTSRFTFSERIHQGRQLIPGFNEFRIPHTQDLVVHHYWMKSWSQLINKHKRYLEKEGRTRFDSGERTSLRIIFIHPLKEFYISYIIHSGFRDGVTGLLLSGFWSWYQTSAQIRLWKFQKQVG